MPNVTLPSAEPAKATSTSGSEWGRLLTSRWLIAAVTVSFLIEAGIIYWCRARVPRDAAIIVEEMPLGRFEFTRSGGSDKQIYRGQFDLFVRLAAGIEASDQQQLVRDQSRWQQAVEDSFRRMRLADFTDPRLTRLKSRVAERLNDEAGYEAVAEVLIANFKIEAVRAMPQTIRLPEISSGEPAEEVFSPGSKE